MSTGYYDGISLIPSCHHGLFIDHTVHASSISVWLSADCILSHTVYLCCNTRPLAATCCKVSWFECFMMQEICMSMLGFILYWSFLHVEVFPLTFLPFSFMQIVLFSLDLLMTSISPYGCCPLQIFLLHTVGAVEFICSHYKTCLGICTIFRTCFLVLQFNNYEAQMTKNTLLKQFTIRGKTLQFFYTLSVWELLCADDSCICCVFSWAHNTDGWICSFYFEGCWRVSDVSVKRTMHET